MGTQIFRIWRLRRPYLVYIRVADFVSGVNLGLQLNPIDFLLSKNRSSRRRGSVAVDREPSPPPRGGADMESPSPAESAPVDPGAVVAFEAAGEVHDAIDRAEALGRDTTARI
jgi:hypothetical protein